MDYEEFYNECWSSISESEISFEQQQENFDNLCSFIFELHRLNHVSGLLTPQIAARIVVSSFRTFVNRR